MKKKGFLFFAVYILVLVGIGVMAVTRAGETSRRKISIYKEGTPEDGTGQETETLQEVLHLTREAEILEVAELPQKQEYNGLRLDDNGMPYAIRINRTLNIVTVYSLDDEGHYTVPVRAMRCSISLDDTTPVGLFTTTEKRLEWAFLQGNVYGQYAYQIHGGIYFHSVPYTENKHDKLETWNITSLVRVHPLAVSGYVWQMSSGSMRTVCREHRFICLTVTIRDRLADRSSHIHLQMCLKPDGIRQIRQMTARMKERQRSMAQRIIRSRLVNHLTAEQGSWHFHRTDRM